jgi:hypothetical protein
MSEEGGGFGLTLVEKMFGFIILVIGALTEYFIYTSISVLGIVYAWFFGILSLILIIIGTLLLIAKTE